MTRGPATTSMFALMRMACSPDDFPAEVMLPMTVNRVAIGVHT